MSDFNQDGYLDMIWTNIGSPTLAYLNNGGENNYLDVKLEDNAKTLGAKIVVTTESGKTLTEDFIVGEGLSSDQSATIHFGLGNEQAKSVTVNYVNHEPQTINNPTTNSVMEILIPEPEIIDTLIADSLIVIE